jgi:hypothetical protein
MKRRREGTGDGGKDSETYSHHATTDASCGKLGRDDGGKRVVSAYPHPHDEAPHDENTDDGDGGTVTGDSLTKGSDNDCLGRKSQFSVSARLVFD